MKRFLGFAGDCYYAEGGWNDFRGAFDSVEDAKAFCLIILREQIRPVSGGWWHVVDTQTREIVAEVDNPREFSAYKREQA